MATPTPPDSLIFKALVREVWEIEPYASAIDILEYMCADNRNFADHCRYYFFVCDEDGKITDDEAYLLEWVEAMQGWKADELRNTLRDTAVMLGRKR